MGAEQERGAQEESQRRALKKFERKIRLWQRRKCRREVVGRTSAGQSNGWREAARELAKYERKAADARRALRELGILDPQVPRLRAPLPRSSGWIRSG